eukprot:c14216_g1_i1.p1 GENE.c14216_g1_i1~~c14216_g1_i1.p1  ORF type:complete len:398 (+),score=73.97 c14216_g1_i1:36-1229(+)
MRRFCVVASYNQALARRIKPDSRQNELISQLAKLQQRILSYDHALTQLAASGASPAQKIRTPRGMYIHGEVGSGKSFCMDLFFESTSIEAKRRAHFHSFMLDIHRRLHELKQDHLRVHGRKRHIDMSFDPITLVALQLAKECRLLCLDEFQVTDVADAMIMRKLFENILSNGTLLVTTSNRPPEDLYHDGVNREYFAPFIPFLLRYCAVFNMNSVTDHRLQLLSSSFQTYFSPSSSDEVCRAFTATADRLLPASHISSITIPVMMGRSLTVRGAMGVCDVTFSQVCSNALSAADYGALAAHFHTVILRNIPRLTTARHNESRRFITLVDELYENHVRLICLAETTPSDLFHHILPSTSLATLTEVISLRVFSPFEILFFLSRIRCKGSLLKAPWVWQ